MPRLCLDCLSNISDRHGNAKRCSPCAAVFAVEVQRARPPRRKLKRPLRLDSTPRSCAVCRAEFTSKSSRRSTCSKACHLWSLNHPGESRPADACRTCGAKLARLRASAKWCSEACRPSRGRAARTSRTRTQPCDFCGSKFTTASSTRRFCSKVCGDRGYSVPDGHARRTGRQCEWCNASIDYEKRTNARHCSDRCTVLANQQVRRARRRNLPAEHVGRVLVFERDSWTCHLCGELVDRNAHPRDPMAPSLDHLIPLAEEGSPGHVWANVACAHLRCNHSKSNRTTSACRARYLELMSAS